jgi:lipoprotein-releasing system permease protein
MEPRADAPAEVAVGGARANGSVGLSWFVARRYLASRRKGRFLSLITLIAVGGIALGVTALITVIAVMTGLQRDLQSKILGSNPHVYVFESGQGLRVNDWREALPAVLRSEGVQAAQPFVSTQVAYTQDASFARAGMLFGIDPTIASAPMTQVEADIREGRLSLGPTASGYPAILVGQSLAGALLVGEGDTLIVAAFENLKTDALGTPTPATRAFEVTGLFRTGMYEYDNAYAYTSLEAAQDLLDLRGGAVTGIFVNGADPWEAREIADRLHRDLGPGYYTNNWMELNASLFSALKLEKLAMGIILFLIVLVAAFNIISTLIMVVTDKTREIGILKAMGMTDRTVLRVFVLQGLTIGVIGTALGALGGLGLVAVIARYKIIDLPADVYFVDTLPVWLDPFDFVLILTLSVLVAFAATIYPARQAARLEPVEAIRHD